MARIAIIEDDSAVPTELARLLERNAHEPVVPTEFAPTDTGDVTAAILAASPDLVLLDLSLPGLDGTLVCREVRARSDVPIIVVTSRSGELDEVLAMSLGADDFVAKPYSANVLLARIDALLRRTSAHAGTVLEHKGVRLDVARAEAVHVASGRLAELTKNETRILAFLMRNAGIVVERATLAAELWDSEAFVDDNTLTVNVNRLRRSLAKIGAESFLATHRGVGYSL